MDLFKKSSAVGVSLTPERGLEVAQIDFATGTVLKYAVTPVDYYNVNQREIADLDRFKEALADLLQQLEISKGTELVMSFPAADFRVTEYPQSWEEVQLSNAVEDELTENFLFKDKDPGFDIVELPGSTMQSKQVAYEAISQGMLIEVARIVEDLGCKLRAIDTSVNSVFNALLYLRRIDTSDAEANWNLLVIENNCCRVMAMQGNSYKDVYEEHISIGEVLEEAENYTTVLNAVEPILKNLPAKYLCVVSKTDVISAEIVANKLNVSSAITYQEANKFCTEPLINVSEGIDDMYAGLISLDVIGAAIYREISQFVPVTFNLFNSSLGEVYTNQQPPEIKIGDKKIVFSNENLIKAFLLILALLIIIILLIFLLLNPQISKLKGDSDALGQEISKLEQDCNEHKDVLEEKFDEGYQVKTGLEQNKAVYSYYTIVGTEIPRKLWLTHLKLGDKISIEGQADNLESVYGFFRSIKDYNPESDIKLQKLGLAASQGTESFDTESLLTSINADYYEFKISNEPEIVPNDLKKDTDNKNNSKSDLPDLEPIKE
ncbi:hypothetical protein IJ750_03850 [bacterium]|nr:hypothetical protein [bacterium]MBR1776188.1 hypothetical protein [bacterium]